MTTIAGFRNTDNIIERYKDRPENWAHTIAVNEPNGMALLYGATAMLKRKSVSSPDGIYHWWEDEIPAFRAALGANLDSSSGAATVTVVSGALKYRINDVLKVEETNERLIVTANPTIDTELAVTRGYQSTTPTAVDYDGSLVNPNLMWVGGAFEEVTSAPPSRLWLSEEKYNYTEIERTTLSISKRMKSTMMRTGDNLKEAKRQALIQHSTALERKFWFGIRGKTTGSGNSTPLTTTGGIESLIPADRVFTPENGELTYEFLDDSMRQVFIFGGEDRMGYCGNQFLSAANQMCRYNSQYTISKGETSWGMKVMEFMTPYGTLFLKVHPMFNLLPGVNPGTDGAQSYFGYNSYCFVLNIKDLSYMYMQDGDTQYQTNLQANDVSGITDGWYSDCGLKLMHPKNHAIIKNVRRGASDPD